MYQIPPASVNVFQRNPVISEDTWYFNLLTFQTFPSTWTAVFCHLILARCYYLFTFNNLNKICFLPPQHIYEWKISSINIPMSCTGRLDLLPNLKRTTLGFELLCFSLKRAIDDGLWMNVSSDLHHWTHQPIWETFDLQKKPHRDVWIALA